MPNYIIYVKAFARVVVKGAKDQEEALDLACDELDLGDLEHDESEAELLKKKDLRSETECAQKVIKAR